jgi:hypothetical protein
MLFLPAFFCPAFGGAAGTTAGTATKAMMTMSMSMTTTTPAGEDRGRQSGDDATRLGNSKTGVK